MLTPLLVIRRFLRSRPGEHFHLFVAHRHPDWRGHPNPERWHFHTPYWHPDHEAS